MALYWDFNKKVGEAVIRKTLPGCEPKEFTINLYQGNAFLIFINEYKENGTDMYNLYSFFCDEAHAKNCLGLAKDTSNIFDDGVEKLVKIRIDKSRHSKPQKLLDMFIKAFDELEIELYKED